jgi:hypothetical protein
MTVHGGKRTGAGRRKDPLKDIQLGAKTALKFLKDIDHLNALSKIFRKCCDPRLQVHIIMKMREWGYDKAAQPLRIANPTGSDGKPVPFEVDITSARDKLTAKLTR